MRHCILEQDATSFVAPGRLIHRKYKISDDGRDLLAVDVTLKKRRLVRHRLASGRVARSTKYTISTWVSGLFRTNRVNKSLPWGLEHVSREDSPRLVDRGVITRTLVACFDTDGTSAVPVNVSN